MAAKQCPNGHTPCDPNAMFCQQCGALLAEVVYRPRPVRRRRRLRWRSIGWVALGVVVLLVAIAVAVSTLASDSDLLPASEVLRRWVTSPAVEAIRQSH